MTPDPRLLLPATLAILDGWHGPVDASGNPAVIVWARAASALVAWLGLGAGSLREVPMSTLSLDLSRAECRDRVARVVPDLGSGGHRLHWRRPKGARTDRGRWRAFGLLSTYSDAPSKDRRFPSHVVPALANLDPNDPTTLPDGSRWVDAAALAAVARQVLAASPT